MFSFIGKHDMDKDRKTGCRDVETTGSHHHQMNLRHQLILIALCVFSPRDPPHNLKSTPEVHVLSLQHKGDLPRRASKHH